MNLKSLLPVVILVAVAVIVFKVVNKLTAGFLG